MIRCKAKAKYGMQMETFILEISWRVKLMEMVLIRLLMVFTLKASILTITWKDKGRKSGPMDQAISVTITKGNSMDLVF